MSLPLLLEKHEQLVNDTLEWNAKLPFLVSVPFLLSQNSPLLFRCAFGIEDLFELISQGSLSSIQKWYFCPKIYIPDGDFNSSTEGWPKLKRDLVESTQ
jgi:hypothetical protein